MSAIDPDLCAAIRSVLSECVGRPLLPAALLTYCRPSLRVPHTLADVQSHLLRMEERGEVTRHANPDDPSILSWSLTEAGSLRASRQ
jgi:hypothetical protein